MTEKKEIVNDKDFIELEFTGRTKDEYEVFDTTNINIAREEGIYRKNKEYGPVKICIGTGLLLQGLDKQLIGKEVGKKYTIEIKPEEAYGRKNPKLIQLIPLNAFRKDNIKPTPGLVVNVDGIEGVVRAVSGGRVIVDFNHPLASKKLVYEVEIKRKITDPKEKLESLLAIYLNVKPEEIEINKEESKFKAIIKTNKKFNENYIKEIKDKIKEIAEIQDCELSFKEKNK